MIKTQWKCRNCDRSFETRGQRDNHNRSKHQKRAADSKLRDAIVEYVEGEKFACECQKTFWHASSLQRHKRNCNASILIIENESESSCDVAAASHVLAISHVVAVGSANSEATHAVSQTRRLLKQLQILS